MGARKAPSIDRGTSRARGMGHKLWRPAAAVLCLLAEPHVAQDLGGPTLAGACADRGEDIRRPLEEELAHRMRSDLLQQGLAFRGRGCETVGARSNRSPGDHEQGRDAAATDTAATESALAHGGHQRLGVAEPIRLPYPLVWVHVPRTGSSFAYTLLHLKSHCPGFVTEKLEELLPTTGEMRLLCPGIRLSDACPP